MVIAALAAWAIAGLLGRGRLAWLAWLAGSWLLLLLGVLSMIAGILPLFGLAAIVLAATLKVHRWATKGVCAGSQIRGLRAFVFNRTLSKHERREVHEGKTSKK